MARGYRISLALRNKFTLLRKESGISKRLSPLLGSARLSQSTTPAHANLTPGTTSLPSFAQRHQRETPLAYQRLPSKYVALPVRLSRALTSVHTPM